MVCMAPTTVFDLFIISYGQAWASFVSYRHTSFKIKITPSKTTLSIIIKINQDHQDNYRKDSICRENWHLSGELAFVGMIAICREDSICREN